jgi:hypothetical protein
MAFSRDWQKQPEDLDLKRSNVKEQEANGQESQTIYRNGGFSTFDWDVHPYATAVKHPSHTHACDNLVEHKRDNITHILTSVQLRPPTSEKP